MNCPEDAIQVKRRAVEVTPADDQALASKLGNKLASRYEHTRMMDDLEEAIRVAKREVEVTPDDHPDFAGRLSELGNKLASRYEHTGMMDDLEEAIRVARRAVEVTPDDHPNLAAWLGNLGIKYGCRYDCTQAMDDLEEAIQMTRQAVEVTPTNHPDFAGRLSNLGNQLERRYERTGKMDDLEEAIRVTRRAVEVMADSHPFFAASLNNLATKLCSQYQRTGMVEDLEESLTLIRQAIKITPDDHPNLGIWLNNLGNQLVRRYARTGKMEDLKESIQVVRHAIQVTPAGHSALATMLTNLGVQLNRSYDRTGDMEDLSEAIRTVRHAIQITSASHKDLASELNSLGRQLWSRYEYTGAMEDLEEAIKLARQAIQITPDGDLNLATMLLNLGNHLGSRYKRTEAIEDLEEAIQVTLRAVEITPASGPALASKLSNLGNKLASRYERTGVMEDLDEAIRVARRAVEVTPDDHPDLAAWLNNLGDHLLNRARCTNMLEDLEEAIRVVRKAIEVTPSDDPILACLLRNLGNQLCSRFIHTEAFEDIDEATLAYLSAWECKNATPFDRINASTLALQMLQLLPIQQHFQVAYDLAVETIHLLPYIHSRSLDHQDQQYVVSHFSGLATTACSLALQTGKGPEAALEVLEQGRGVILGLLMDDRSDTSELKASYPEICAQYEDLLLEVNKPIKGIMDDRTQNSAFTNRREALTQLDECVRNIQQLPGFSQFHKCLTTQQMQNCSINGSIVVVNVTRLRSDAIIVTADAFKAIPLPGLNANRTKDWIGQNLTTTSFRDRGRKNKAYSQFLLWLWYECVKLVLDELHYDMQPSADDLPRVWWIGTGLASDFPFHSAGDTSAGLSESACYRAISSYTPTIKALQYSRGHTNTASSILPSRDHWRVVIVTMPETPCASPLPGTRLEKVEVMAAMGPSVSIETLEHPDVGSVVAQLQQCNIAHFACHGVSNLLDPSKSGLILQIASTVTGEYEQDILSVRAVSQTHLSRAEIAYLSACSTAQNQVEKLSDEVLHVVSGFQVAGFRHVVGCLWPSDDKVCVEVAKSFYSALSQNRAANFNDDRAIALALHKAVLKVRESKDYCKRPLLWAQYVHFGA